MSKEKPIKLHKLVDTPSIENINTIEVGEYAESVKNRFNDFQSTKITKTLNTERVLPFKIKQATLHLANT